MRRPNKALKVTIEYENGVNYILEGRSATEFNNLLDTLVSLMASLSSEGSYVLREKTEKVNGTCQV